MGTLVLLALARLFVAPEPSPASTDANTTAPSPATTTEAPSTAGHAANHTAGDASGNSRAPLLLIDFRSRATALNASPAAYDLRNPFRPTADHGSTSATKRQRASARRPDLLDPFAEPPRRRRVPARPAEDLRNPFSQPAPALPKCPDTGGVPIQRPDTVRARCGQASLDVVLAHR